MPSPILRIVRLQVKGLAAIRALNLPEDGLGWDGFPSVVVVGGINGSGKTTLLHFLARALHLLVEHPPAIPPDLLAEEAVVDFEIRDREGLGGQVRFLIGSKAFVQQHRTTDCFGYSLTGGRPRRIMDGIAKSLHGVLSDRARFAASSIPSVLYISSEFRALQTPHEPFKSPGKMAPPDEFVYLWLPAVQWKDSLEARLYAARWEDLNAKEEGRPAGRFDAYAYAFQEFTGRAKALVWNRGELAIEIRSAGSQQRHSIDELSSGEKQVLIIASELLLRWRPGSLVLLDEPELHLHTAWQLKLWEVLLRFLNERGGQLIVATQSPQLFGMAEPGTSLLLGTQEL